MPCQVSNIAIIIMPNKDEIYLCILLDDERFIIRRSSLNDGTEAVVEDEISLGIVDENDCPNKRK